MKSSKGFITVNSEFGQGTEFKVYLPESSEKLVFDEEQQDTPILKGTEHILVVDDEASVAEITRETLIAEGYRVTAISSPLEALGLFKANPDAFDLLVTDYVMPDMSGSDLGLEIKKIKPDMPVIVITGYFDGINKETTENLGFDKFLMKPVANSMIFESIREALDERE